METGLLHTIKRWCIRIPLIALITLASFNSHVDAAELSEEFQQPPDATQPWCYWYWMDGDVSKEGITKDIETMSRVGIQRAMIGNINIAGGKGPVKMMSPEWTALTWYAFHEAAKFGVELYMFNGPGWSQSGGPWIKPEQSMRRVTWAEFPATGGTFSKKVRPAGLDGSQDIAVLAVPAIDSVSVPGVPLGKNAVVFKHTESFTARALLVYGKTRGKLYALENGNRKLVAAINARGGNPKTDFLSNAVAIFSFADVRAQEFVLELDADSAFEAILTSEPRVAQAIEKQMGRMHPTPSPSWQSYQFSATVEPGDPSTLIGQGNILDLTDKLNADGELNGTLPAGDWTVIYFGMITTGAKNQPAPAEATGLEVDKMNTRHVRHHFESMFGELLDQMTPAEKAAFKGITIDSYEVGAQNWTDGFAAEFEKRNGYDPIRFLPVMTGRVVDSAGASDQFLWDLRRTVADMIAEYYVGGLREIAHEHDLLLWCENYGHWGFPGEFLIYGGYADQVSGEFWTKNRNLGTIECRAASSAAHIYGKQRVYAEAFTSRLDLKDHPYRIKARGEELFCEGINHFVLHVYAHQPRDGVPGRNPWFGTAFHRNNPWFHYSRSWVRYLQRCHYMLQQGEPVADVAVYIGDFAPQMTGPSNPLPPGYDYDYIGSDAILRKLQVVDGQWVVYDEHDPGRIAARWKVLALPEVGYIRPHVARRLAELQARGGAVIEGVPVAAATLQAAGIAPLVSQTSCPLRWKVRRLDDGGKIFFLSNFETTGTFEATLRVAGLAPELFNPVTGEIRKMARYKMEPGKTRITIDVKDRSDSFFVVFRNKPLRPSVVSLSSEGREIGPDVMELSHSPDGKLIGRSARPGAYTVKLSNGDSETLTIDSVPQPIPLDAADWKTKPGGENGHAVRFETQFDLPPDLAREQRVLLHLGEVEVMATVKLNGKTFDTLWMPPFVLDVTDALKTNGNDLQVLVAPIAKGAAKLGEVELSAASEARGTK